METRIIVCGGTDFEDYAYMKDHLDILVAGYQNVKIVSGHAKGADALGEKYASEKPLPLSVFPAEWERYGRAAGPIRNKCIWRSKKERRPPCMGEPCRRRRECKPLEIGFPDAPAGG